MTQHIFDPAAYDTRNIPQIGGKGINLLRLQQHHPVPQWIALPAECFIDFLHNNRMYDRIAVLIDKLEDSNIAAIAAEIHALITGATLPEFLQNELQQTALIGTQPEGFFAVRSSAGDEDGTKHSFAGIHESFLYVKGYGDICNKIRQVWASGYDERALLYRRDNALRMHPVPMAVIIQQMIPAAISGVAFTAEPAGNNPFHVVISALYGLGEGLVGGGLAADHTVFDKITRKTETATADKESQYALDDAAGKGVTELPVDPAKRHQSVLTEAQIKLIVNTALEIEREYQRPQDIEFCFNASGILFILQTRAITTITDFGPAAGNRQIWDNSNIIESYSGVTSPMTFSFIKNAYTVVYHCFSNVMGISRKRVSANRHVFENMLGLINGQVYYNLANWYRLIQQFPGYGMNKRFMESMMGLREQFDPDEADGEEGAAHKWLIEFPRLLCLILRILYRFALIDRMVNNFQVRFHTLYTKWEQMNFRTTPPHELLSIYREMENKLLWNWQAPIVNDFYVMINYGLLKKISRDWCGDDTQSLQNDLICGNGDIESTEPTRMLMQLALQIRMNPKLTTLFNETTPARLAEILPGDPRCRDIAERMDEYLKRYGFRCINELKLEEPSLRDNPEFVYQVLKNYMNVDEHILDAEAMAGREQQIRRTAEGKADDALNGQRFASVKKIIFRKVLKNARKGVMNRENMRFCRTRIYGVLRELLNAMGAHLTDAGKLDAPHDVFMLTIDELWDFVKGTAVTTNLRGLAELRRTEFDYYRSKECPPAEDHFETFGMVYYGNSFRQFSTITAAEGDLSGTGCCPGVVTAPVRIVHSPKDDLNLNGCILVAGRTDPGWVPLYPAVSGILIERGSILSHSAIVAREMGIPTIVGINGLLEKLSDGQVVTMDGQQGTVSLSD